MAKPAARLPRGGVGLGMYTMALADISHTTRADAPENMMFAQSAEAAIEPAVA